MERSPMLLNKKDQHSKNAILPKAIYSFSAIPIKIQTQFFTDLERMIINSICEKKSRIAETILYNKESSGSIIIPEIKLIIELQ